LIAARRSQTAARADAQIPIRRTNPSHVPDVSGCVALEEIEIISRAPVRFPPGKGVPLAQTLVAAAAPQRLWIAFTFLGAIAELIAKE
jgi:hypothetical protein